MCFSATASFTAGAGLLVIGAITIRLSRDRAELPFAAIPVLFGVQQLIEGALWLTFPDKAPLLNAILTHIYSLFSHVLWPVYVPIAVLLLEPISWRRRVLAWITVAGGAVGLYLLYYLITQPLVAQVEGQHITYISPHFYTVPVMIFYILSTCVSSLFSSCGTVRSFGFVSLLASGAAGAFYSVWFISVWCFFAAILSAIILLHFIRQSASRSDPAEAANSARSVMNQRSD